MLSIDITTLKRSQQFSQTLKKAVNVSGVCRMAGEECNGMKQCGGGGGGGMRLCRLLLDYNSER